MSDSAQRSSLVFIISQPRAGSTLLQTMLAGHPDVHAPGEAWLMLPLVHAIAGSRRAVQSPYDQCLADDAVGEFVRENLDGGWAEVQDELGEAARRLYASALQRAGKEVLIDKTPRYYWIIEDLLRLVPECRIVVLLRNPLAVLSSIMKTWTRRTRVGFLKDYRGDLLEAPTRLAAAISLQDPRIVSLRYEDLVQDPSTHLNRLQDFIGLPRVDRLENYGTVSQRTYGDPLGIHQHQSSQTTSLDKYLQAASERATDWRLLSDYRQHLGKSLLERLGYDDAELERALQSVRPKGTAIAPSLASQVSPRPAEPKRSVIRIRRVTADLASRAA